MFSNLQQLLTLLISVAVFVAAVWAMVEVLRYPNNAFVAAGKRTKTFWGVIIAVALVIAFLGLPPPFGAGGGIIGLFGIAAIAAVLIFFIDVRPKLKDHTPRGPSNPQRGGW